MTAIPASAAAIDATWLNEVLAPHGVGTISKVAAKNLGEGVGILAEVTRLTLTYENGQSGPGTLVAKVTSPAPENGFLCQMMGFYAREVSFYQQVAPTLTAVRAPRCYHADVSADGAQFILLLEEVRDARCPNQIEGISVNDANRIIDVVAALHIAHWDSPELDAMTWLPPMNNPLYKAGGAMGQANWAGFVESYGDELTTEMLDVAKRCVDNYPALLDWMVSLGHPTLTHTDCRAENYLFGGSAGDDAITVVDFQLCTRHVGVWDVANLVGASLLPEVRREHGESLVRRYHATIEAAGIDYSWETCWRDFLACILQQTSAQVITANLAGGNERGTALLRQLHVRPLLAAQDYDAGALLAEVGF
jgi:aminoglycoside/choline kinase family phosphotransferase